MKVSRQLFAGQSFAGQSLKGQSFKGQDLTGADFRNAQIQGADFTAAILNEANFREAKAGARPWAIALMLLLMAGSGCLLALLGNAIADTVNSGYLHYFGPRDASLVFGTLLLFTALLWQRDLVSAISGTILGG